MDYGALMAAAIAEARLGLAEGGIPAGAVLADAAGNIIGRGRNRRVQRNDALAHSALEAFRDAGPQPGYRDKVLALTVAPCWCCSGLVRQFDIGTLVVGDADNFRGGLDWLWDRAVKIVNVGSAECVTMLRDYIRLHPHVWAESVGE